MYMKLKAQKLSPAILSIMVLLMSSAACQPTPETVVVVNKNAGVMESAISDGQNLEATTEPYSAPDKLEFELDGLPDGYRIIFDASVDVSGQTAWPVYTVEQARFSQQQADTVRQVLLGDVALYKQGEYHSREEIQRSIDSYESQLRISSEKGHKELVDSYTQILKDLYIEYERTPEDLTLEEASTEFSFMEEIIPAHRYDANEVVTEDGGTRYEWTDEARRQAVADGWESIHGVCWMDNGRKMMFDAGNGPYGCSIGFFIADGNLAAEPGVSCTLNEAVGQADNLLAAMGLDFVLVESKTMMQGEFTDDNQYVEIGPWYHALTYKRRIEGVPQDNITSFIKQNVGKDYSSPVPAQESISIFIDDFGIREFYWTAPMNVAAVENPNVTLMPFDDITQRISAQLKVQTMWDERLENEKEWIDARRLEITKIRLSYLMVAKANDMTSYYLIPVWHVCGDLFYHYIDSYPTGDSDTYILDENFERNVWRMLDDTADHSVLTLNAIDGSVIPRRRF
jgi:hypothetical protein